MLEMILRKMLKNTWMVACLLLGSTLSVALFSSIPVYTDGILQRLLTKDMERFQTESGMYPGRCLVKGTFYDPDTPAKKLATYKTLDQQITQVLAPKLGVPLRTWTRELSLEYLTILPADGLPAKNRRPVFVRMEGMRDFEEHVELVAGRAPEPGIRDGVVEALISEKVMKDLSLYLGGTYDLWDEFVNARRMARVEIVGVFAPASLRDPFWFKKLQEYDESLMVDIDTLERSYLGDEADSFTYYCWTSWWFYALDYHAITLRALPKLASVAREFSRFAKELEVEWDVPILAILEQYGRRATALQLTLWFLHTPVLLMIASFIAMVSQRAIEGDANEIAVLKSRGSSSWQVFLLYLTESVILSAVAMAAGPPLGVFVCRVLGASSGFLEFVQRRALPVRLSRQAYLYALLGTLLFALAMLLPALVASRRTIVEHKKRRGRAQGGVSWKRLFPDAILLAISAYAMYRYHAEQSVLTITGVEGSRLPLDPLLFVTSVSLILGLGLLFLRVFPILVRGLFRLGRGVWTPVLYASLVQVGRSLGHAQFVMVFLMLSLALGVYNSVTARTINRNAEERILYDVGADVVMQPHWVDAVLRTTGGVVSEDGTALAAMESAPEPQWVEPPYSLFARISGTAAATKVFVNAEATVTAKGSRGQTRLMGIVPGEFGNIAWFRADLLPVHWHNYLNLLAGNPMAMLVSSNLKDEWDLRLGDVIRVSWGGMSGVEGYVYAFIDFWPTYNPREKRAGDKPDALVVAGLSYLQAKMPLEPYQVWLKKAPGATSQQLFDDIREKGLEIDSLEDASQRIVAARNDPVLQGTNGALTLGFIIATGISIVGFVISCVLTVRGRTLQFGILRAMGLSQSRVIGMILAEQLLISGTAILAGIVIGGAASAISVPLLQLTSSAAAQVPPFRVVALTSDLARVLIGPALMLLTGVALLLWLVPRVRMHQAIKLGED